MSERDLSQGQTSSQLPITSAQDVEFSEAQADEEDREARERAARANRRVQAGEEG